MKHKPTPPKPSGLSSAGFRPGTMKLKNPRTNAPDDMPIQSEPPCCSNPAPPETKPTPLVPILFGTTAFVIVASLGFVLNQQDKLATQRQTIHDLICHVEGLKFALQEAKAVNGKQNKKSFCVQISNLSASCGKTFTNYFEYPPKFLLKD